MHEQHLLLHNVTDGDEGVVQLGYDALQSSDSDLPQRVGCGLQKEKKTRSYKVSEVLFPVNNEIAGFHFLGES